MKRGLLLAVIWTVVGFTFAALALVPLIGSGRPAPIRWWLHVRWTLVQYYIWGCLTPVIILMVRRFPIDRQHWYRSLLVYAPGGIFFPGMWALLFCSIYWTMDGPFIGETPPNFATFLRVTFFNRFLLLLLIYLIIMFLAHAIDYYRKYQERELRLAQSQLQALKAQLHPHFLFNTLNAISELVYRDPEAADRTITELSDLLRVTLKRSAEEEISLRDELDFLEKYIDIHRTLFQDRLTVEMRVDPESLDASVPNLVLQPLVENAIRHGIDPHSKAGRIEISAERKDSMLHLVVSDNGPGLPADWQEASKVGIGLANTKARLAHMYGKSHRFELSNASGGGLIVNLKIPFRPLETRGDYESSYSDS